MIRNVAVFLLLLMAAMVLHLVFIHGHYETHDRWTLPADCLFRYPKLEIRGEPAKWMIASIVLRLTGPQLTIEAVYPEMAIFMGKKFERRLHAYSGGM